MRTKGSTKTLITDNASENLTMLMQTLMIACDLPTSEIRKAYTTDGTGKETPGIGGRKCRNGIATRLMVKPLIPLARISQIGTEILTAWAACLA